MVNYIIGILLLVLEGVTLRLSAVRQADFFAKVLADGTIGFLVTLRLRAEGK